MRALTEISASLEDAGSDYNAVLAAAARRTAELLGDHCAIRMVSDDGRFLKPVASHDPDEEALQFFRGILASVPPAVDEQATMRRVLEAGQPLIIPKVDLAPLRAALKPEYWPILDRVGAHSLLFVPLRFAGRSIGLLHLSRHRADAAPYDEHDARLALDLAHRASLSIAYARLYAELQLRSQQLEVETVLRQRSEQENQRLRAAEQAHEQARREAERANQAKSEFLSRMSHELRTPLNAVLGFAQLLEMDPLSDEQRESLGYILKAGKHLLELINEVLDIARIEAGRLAVSLESVAVIEVVREALTLVAPLAAERAIHIQPEIPETDGPVVQADRQRLKQVLLNLLSNAVKYNKVGGSVLLSCEVVPGRLRLRVTDTGPGIPPDRHERLFIPFERLGTTQGGVEGTGLGLALSKRLVEAMDGAIGVETQVGQGSTFWIELPAGDPADETAAPPADISPVRAAPVAAQATSQRTFTVLYIEDNLSNLELIERILARRPGVRLLSAMQGRLGLNLAREHQPDLVLLDMRLPDVPGDEVLRRLQADLRTRLIPAVVMSSESEPGQREQLLAAGAHACLPKPVDVRELINIVDEALRLRIAR